MGFNFETLRPRQEILSDYAHILERIYYPEAFAGRLRRLSTLLHNSSRKQSARKQDSRRGLSRLEILHRIIANLPEPRDLFRRILAEFFASNPEAMSRIVLLMALYLDVGSFSRNVIARTEGMITALNSPAAAVAR